MALFEKLRDADYVVHTWFERDRAHVRLETPNGRSVFELWDEDVEQAIEDGFLRRPFSGEGWHASAIGYARDMGLI